MFDAAPPLKLSLPPKPAIIRARGDALDLLAQHGKKAVFPFPAFCPRVKTFPVIAAQNTTSFPNASGTSVSVNLPAGISAWDILLLSISAGTTITAPAGWATLVNQSSGGANIVVHAVFWKIANGSEGSTVSVTIGAEGNCVCVSHRITNALSVEAAYAVSGTSSAGDPPSLSPSWGSDKTLWIESVGYRSRLTSDATLSSGYGGLNQVNSGASGGGSGWTCSTITGYRTNAAPSENPSALSPNAGNAWVAVTIGVQPR